MTQTRFTFRAAAWFGLALGATVIVIAIAACTGADGPQGPPGLAGTSGTQGTAGSAGPTGATGPAGPGADGGLPTSCLSPCHGFNGIVEQWKTSTHYSTFVANLGGEEVATWTGATACGNCHAIDALAGRVAGSVGVQADGGVTNATKGELGYRVPTTGSLGESTYTGTAKVAAVTCVTCHSVTDVTDPHRTGLAYAPGSFPLRVASGATDEAFIEKSPDTTAVTGMSAGKLGTANTCVFCHKSRKDVTNYIKATNALSSSRWGPHNGPQADVFSGVGGYHFTGMTYGNSTHQAKLTCVDCHMPGVTTNGSSPNHSFYAQVSACQSCHVGATNFDITGGQSQIKAAMLELQSALNAAGYLTRSAAAPYVALTTAELGDGHFELDGTRPNGGADGGVPSLTANQAGALYNYLIVARGGALGVHNPKYVRQLLFDSYVAIAGKAPATLVRPQ